MKTLIAAVIAAGTLLGGCVAMEPIGYQSGYHSGYQYGSGYYDNNAYTHNRAYTRPNPYRY